MAISIYKLFQVTFNDYKRDYDGYLTEFLNEYEDNTELYFIKEQKSILDNHLVKFKEVVMNLIETDENKEEILDLFRNRINTTDRIKEFLEERKQELNKESNSKVPAPKNSDKINLNLEEIALKLVWEDVNVTRENAKSFLIETEFKSGDKLYNHYKFYRNHNDRREDPEGKVKLKNKINIFEKVIKTLDDEFKQKAEDELKTLKKHLSKY